MSEINDEPDFIDASLERALRVERAINLVSKVVNLELADLALSGTEISEETKLQLQTLGGAFIRLSSTGMSVANEIATTLGENPSELSTLPAARHLPQPVVVSKKADATVRQENPASPVVRPTASVAAKDTLTTTVPAPASTPVGTSRLDQPQHASSRPDTQETQEQKSHTKKKFEGELYEAIVPEKTTPLIELREGMVPINIRISTDNMIIIEGTKIELEDDRLFIFNGLMRLRDHIMRARDIQDLGFRPDVPATAAAQAFSKAMVSIRSELNQAAGIEIVKRIGEKAGTKYAVNPAVTLIDERSPVPTAPGDENVKKK
jgi:hypothetical protein